MQDSVPGLKARARGSGLSMVSDLVIGNKTSGSGKL